MPVTFSFGGAGYHFPFMLGVAYGLQSNFVFNPEEIYVHAISGGMAGAIPLLLYSPEEIEQLQGRAVELAHANVNLSHTDYTAKFIQNLLVKDASVSYTHLRAHETD